MKKIQQSLILTLLLVTTQIIGQKNTLVQINTSKGAIQIELLDEKTPITVENFLNYVKNNLYENSSFFRVCTPQNEVERAIQIQVIQGGNIHEKQLLPAIPIETTLQTGIKHENGTISMARGEPNSAKSSFFICINDQPSLDYKGKRNPDLMGFAAFGKVIKGMDIVHEIQQGKNKNQYLIDKVSIINIEILN